MASHSMNILHRDISPDNFIVQNDGSFKLIDFGSARAYTGAQNLTINLKENFAPLEQYSETGQGRYTDVYSLAATMYYAYTGKLVPIGRDTEQRESELTMAMLNAGLSMRQANALKKALSAKPINRYQSMQEFAEAYSPASALPVTIFSPSRQVEQSAGFSEKIAASLALMKKQPAYPVIAGALVIIALVLYLFL